MQSVGIPHNSAHCTGLVTGPKIYSCYYIYMIYVIIYSGFKVGGPLTSHPTSLDKVFSTSQEHALQNNLRNNPTHTAYANTHIISNPRNAQRMERPENYLWYGTIRETHKPPKLASISCSRGESEHRKESICFVRDLRLQKALGFPLHEHS